MYNLLPVMHTNLTLVRRKLYATQRHFNLKTCQNVLYYMYSVPDNSDVMSMIKVIQLVMRKEFNTKI